MKILLKILLLMIFVNESNAKSTVSNPPADESKTSAPTIQRKTHDEDFAAFKTNAAAWRALTNKPPLPQEVHKYQVLAADAVQEKRFEDAVNYYEQGLAIEPCWPDAQHDVALIDSELGNYGDAAFHMRCYVELVPNAPDAQAAGDQIIIWDEKMKKQQQEVEYIVQPGDSFKAIFKTYKIKNPALTVDKILKANPDLNEKSIFHLEVGQKIIIPIAK